MDATATALRQAAEQQTCEIPATLTIDELGAANDGMLMSIIHAHPMTASAADTSQTED